MIDIYFWPTPNGFKVNIYCEEAGVPYKLVPVNIGAGDQFSDDFLSISPNNRMPAIVDPDGPDGRPIAIFESGAILIYLAEKYGKFLPADTRGRFAVLQWLMWQMAGIGPMLGQTHHFRMYAYQILTREMSEEEADVRLRYGRDRYTNEARRLYGVLDNELEGKEFICGDYSIADMATWPWILPYKRQGVGEMEDFPNVRRWFDAIKDRPAVRKAVDDGRALAEEARKVSAEESQSNLFGQRQFERRKG
ncbi:MAG: glutathione S-transferase N-terminal domain-containing protein [Thermoanaerobaculia bacterium]|nr:glutathione S-transferase N-terminal domain-containing protein [Thermoanaerobaculia bacterium]